MDRIQIVCRYYRGAHWTIHYDSEEGGYWSVALMNPEPDGEERTEQITPFGFAIQTGPPNHPIFAMRCQELEVVASSIEHWHASVLSRDVPT